MVTVLDDIFRRTLTTVFTVYALLALAVSVVIVFAIRAFVRTYVHYRGTRIVTCPETEQYAAVEVDTSHAAMTCLWRNTQLRLADCSRWPKRQKCAQDCLWQIDLSPIGCRLRELLNGWYLGKKCAFCGRVFGQVQWLEHKPGLLSPRGSIVEWSAILPEAIPDALLTYKPVCAQCKAVETFRADHSDLVTERPWH